MKLQQNTNYHRVLRLAAVLCAVVLVFESGLLADSTKNLAMQTHRYIATAIGMSASVQPTELNMLTAELTQRTKELDAREAALNEREITVGLATDSGNSNDKTVYLLAGILFILLVLILLNYTLDYLRLRETRESQRTQPV